MLQKNCKLKYSIIVCISIFIIFSILLNLDFLSNIQLKLSDNLYGGKKPLDSIVIVAVDDKSLQEIGRWPWPREKFLDLFLKLNESKIIAVDIAFFENYSSFDEELGKAIKDNGNVILPVEFTSFSLQDGKIIGKDVMMPIEPLKSSASKLGYINLMTDFDGITRAMLWDLSSEFDSFSYAVYRDYWKKEISYKKQRFLINFLDAGAFPRISAADILKGRVNTSMFKNKLVFLGATAPDLHDEYFVPTSKGKAMPGVEIHANAVQTMIISAFLKEESTIAVMLSILLFSILTALLLYEIRLWKAALFSLVLLLAYNFFAIKIFDFGIIMNLVYPSLTVLFTFISLTSLFYLSEEKSKKKVLSAFGKYVSPQVLAEILKNIDKELHALQGSEREISVLFADIRGFTALSEKMKPREVVKMLNRYLGAMTLAVFENQGTLDKYVGDCVMAVFNAPIDQKEHTLLAIKTALEMQRKIEKLNKKQAEKVYCGIGINTGMAIVGNIGSSQRLDYTSIGDAVNTASRLCGIAKVNEILISESTYQQVQGKVKVRELEPVKVKGKKHALRIYRVLGLEERY